MNNRGFLFIPMLAGAAGWLSTATIGSILTIFGGGFILSWLVAHILIPIAIVLGLLLVGITVTWFSIKSFKSGAGKVGVIAGIFLLLLSIVMWGKFFGGYVLIPGILSFSSEVTTFSVAGSNPLTSYGITLPEPIKWIVIGIVVASFIMIYRYHKGVKK